MRRGLRRRLRRALHGLVVAVELRLRGANGRDHVLLGAVLLGDFGEQAEVGHGELRGVVHEVVGDRRRHENLDLAPEPQRLLVVRGDASFVVLEGIVASLLVVVEKVRKSIDAEDRRNHGGDDYDEVRFVGSLEKYHVAPVVLFDEHAACTCVQYAKYHKNLKCQPM